MIEWMIAFLTGFSAGFGGDRAYLYSRTHEWRGIMPKTPKPINPPPDWYARYAPTIMLVLIGVVVTSFIVTIYGIRADQKQTDEFAQRNLELLQCVGDWADAFTESSQPVRDATVARDKAVREYRAAQDVQETAEDRLTALFLELVTNPNENPTPEEQAANRERFLRVLQRDSETSKAEQLAYDDYKAAEDHLEAVRAANPLPTAPEDRCEEFVH